MKYFWKFIFNSELNIQSSDSTYNSGEVTILWAGAKFIYEIAVVPSGTVIVRYILISQMLNHEEKKGMF